MYLVKKVSCWAENPSMSLPPAVKTLFPIIFSLWCWKSLVLAWLLNPAWVVMLWTGHLRWQVREKYAWEVVYVRGGVLHVLVLWKVSVQHTGLSNKCAVCTLKTFSRHEIQERCISILLHIRIGDICTIPVSVRGWLPAHQLCSHLLVFHREWKKNYQMRFQKIIYNHETYHRGLGQAWILHHPCCCVNADWDYCIWRMFKFRILDRARKQKCLSIWISMQFYYCPPNFLNVLEWEWSCGSIQA